jgi:phosphoribosyl-ATP pyrophosphohydrolase
MIDIEKEVLEWHRKTFPNATNQAVYEKLWEEVDELKQSCIDSNNIAGEIADVCIVSITLLDRFGMSLSEIIKDKLEINKRRNWGEETENGDRPRIKLWNTMSL